MESLIRQISEEVNPSKQKQLIISLMVTSNFSHPQIQGILSELKLTAEDLNPRPYSPTNNKGLSDLTDFRNAHQEARRLAKIEILAEIIQEKQIFAGKSQIVSRKSLVNSTNKGMTSFRSILSSEPDIPLAVPLSQDESSQRLIDQQQKKLERLLKVSDKIKSIKFEDERRRVDIVKDLEEKTEKYKLLQQGLEEERLKKKLENDFKRQSKLQKKYHVPST